MIPGIGIGLGFGGVGVMSPGRYASDLASILGASLVSLLLAEDAVVSGATVASCAARVGGTNSYQDSNRFSLGRLNGRKAFSSGPANPAIFAAVQTAHITEYFAVYKANVASPSDYRGVAMGLDLPSATPRRALLQQNGAATWYAGALSWTRDSVATNAVDTSVHLYSSVVAHTVEATTLYVGNDFGAAASRSCDGLIGVVFGVNGTISANQRAAVLDLNKRFFRY